MPEFSKSQSVRGEPRTLCDQKKWGIFRCHNWGSLIRHQQLEQKLAIVAEMERCDNIAAYSRQYDIPTSLLYTWRREFRYALAARQVADPDSDHAPMFVPVVADSPKPKSHDVAIEVELGGAVVRIGRTASPGLATAVIEALQVRR